MGSGKLSSLVHTTSGSGTFRIGGPWLLGMVSTVVVVAARIYVISLCEASVVVFDFMSDMYFLPVHHMIELMGRLVDFYCRYCCYYFVSRP